jgi:hypothetical protein
MTIVIKFIQFIKQNSRKWWAERSRDGVSKHKIPDQVWRFVGNKIIVRTTI